MWWLWPNLCLFIYLFFIYFLFYFIFIYLFIFFWVKLKQEVLIVSRVQVVALYVNEQLIIAMETWNLWLFHKWEYENYFILHVYNAQLDDCKWNFDPSAWFCIQYNLGLTVLPPDKNVCTKKICVWQIRDQVLVVRISGTRMITIKEKSGVFNQVWCWCFIFVIVSEDYYGGLMSINGHYMSITCTSHGLLTESHGSWRQWAPLLGFLYTMIITC